ncbi:MAG: DUF4367 domain-containing protein [Clostridia bacterium]|nr:DUF4367 domain-containing protein [Clostridia bacterium]
MEAAVRTLEQKLNRIIDDEMKKTSAKIDADLVMECSYALLRFENEDRYVISEECAERAKSEIIASVRGNGRLRMTRTARALLVAAVILALTVISVFGIYCAVKYDIIRFGDHSELILHGGKPKKVEDLEIGYIPEGYTVKQEIREPYGITITYNNGADDLIVSKISMSKNDYIGINTEFEEPTEIEYDNIDYLLYGDNEHGYGVMFNKNGFLYRVFFETPEELLRIARSIG